MDAFWSKEKPCVEKIPGFFVKEKKKDVCVLCCMKNNKSMRMSSKSDPLEFANINFRRVDKLFSMMFYKSNTILKVKKK